MSGNFTVVCMVGFVPLTIQMSAKFCNFAELHVYLALFTRISFKLGKLLFFKAVFPAVSMDDGCLLIALYKKLKKKVEGPTEQ